MLRDCYANYVIQTSVSHCRCLVRSFLHAKQHGQIDYADTATRQRLADAILPLLPLIRNFPYGRRIQTKLAMGENKGGMGPSAAPGHSRSNSYSQPSQARTVSHTQGPVRPAPVQHSYQQRPELTGAQFLL